MDNQTFYKLITPLKDTSYPISPDTLLFYYEIFKNEDENIFKQAIINLLRTKEDRAFETPRKIFSMLETLKPKQKQITTEIICIECECSRTAVVTKATYDKTNCWRCPNCNKLFSKKILESNRIDNAVYLDNLNNKE